MSVACHLCGRRADGDEPPLTWTTAIERGRVRCYCEACTREHLRSMEARLDSEWW